MATTVSHTWQELINNPSLITNYYLYGQATKPTADQLVSDKWIRQQGVVDIIIKISNFDSYMNEGPGRYANASQIDVVSGFFEAALPILKNGEKVMYSLTEAISKFGTEIPKFSLQEEITQTDYNGNLDGTGGKDYAARVYEFQTQVYALNQNVKFVIERKADGQYVRRIENFALLPRPEDFDFIGGSDLVNLGNDIIENDIDPSRIGRTVNIQYPSSAEKTSYSTRTYTSASYAQDQIRFTREDHGTYSDAYQPVKNLVANMWAKGTTKFIDPQERAILYGTNTSNQLSGDAHSAFAYDSYMQEYYSANLQKGIAIVAGGGSDTLRGSAYEDYLNGGQGYDKYYANNGDSIVDSDGSGIIIFEGRVLHGVDVTMDSTIYPSNQEHTAYYSKADKGTYYRNENKGFSFVADGTNHTLTVYTPLDYTLQIIPKPGGGTMKQKTYRGVGVVLENFSSPLVLDLNHDGVTSLDLYATPAHFDMEGDGIREKSGWIQSTDALLAFDKNQDGIINDGSELFGNYTTLANGTKADNGFEALEQYDNNHDGVIDKNDSVYDALSAWVDSDQDGITDNGELHSLSELGVTSINLNATTTTAYEDQNAITHTSTFTQQTTDAEGNTITETNAVNDVWFRKDTTNTLSTVTISDTIAALPQINGSGRVLDLHGAINFNFYYISQRKAA